MYADSSGLKGLPVQRGVEYLPKMQVDQATTVAGLVKKQVGVAVMPYLGILPIQGIPGLQVSEVIDGPLRSMGIVTRRNSHPNHLAIAAMDQTRLICHDLIQTNPGLLLSPSTRKRLPSR